MPRLEIGNYFVEELLVKSNSEYDVSSTRHGDLERSIDFDFYRKDEKDPQFLVKLSVDLGDNPEDNLPYHIKVSVFGAFDASNDSNQTLIEQLVATNAAPILYGIARGIVGQATSQALHGRYVLPTVNFIELAKKKVQTLEAAAKAG